jgi:hypothetical protein
VARDDNRNSAPLRFQSVRQNEVPKARKGKHKKIVEQTLRQIDLLAPGAALKVPLASLPDTKANIRAALNRATHQKGLAVATSSDSNHLYIWNVARKS